jgi:hypothetical protein
MSEAVVNSYDITQLTFLSGETREVPPSFRFRKSGKLTAVTTSNLMTGYDLRRQSIVNGASRIEMINDIPG